MLIGCAQDLIFSDVNRDTVEVLARNGCEVITPAEQLCCGSLHAHNGEWELAQQLARRQIDQNFHPNDLMRSIQMRAVAVLAEALSQALAVDPMYEKSSMLWDEKVKDVHEWLMQIGIQAPPKRAPPR